MQYINWILESELVTSAVRALEPTCKQYCSDGLYKTIGERFWPEVILPTYEQAVEYISNIDQRIGYAMGAAGILLVGSAYYMRNRAPYNVSPLDVELVIELEPTQEDPLQTQSATLAEKPSDNEVTKEPLLETTQKLHEETAKIDEQERQHTVQQRRRLKEANRKKVAAEQQLARVQREQKENHERSELESKLMVAKQAAEKEAQTPTQPQQRPTDVKPEIDGQAIDCGQAKKVSSQKKVLVDQKVASSIKAQQRENRTAKPIVNQEALAQGYKVPVSGGQKKMPVQEITRAFLRYKDDRVLKAKYTQQPQSVQKQALTELGLDINGNAPVTGKQKEYYNQKMIELKLPHFQV